MQQSNNLSLDIDPPEFILQKRDSKVSKHIVDSTWSLKDIPCVDLSDVAPPATDEVPDSPRPQYEVQCVENVFITMEDGVKLSARLWLPRADCKKFSAIFEFLPYCKRYGTTHRDEINYNFIACYGFVCVRVDLRGTGESEGITTDEYTAQEQKDALAVIEWISTQPWSNGRVGMTGLSWGGFNSLQTATAKPPALKGILAMCCSDNRYNVDVHYSGGCLLLDNIAWGAYMLTLLGTPPDPSIVGGKWRDMWLDRLENCKPPIVKWMEHQTYDDYWKFGSICEKYDSIECPVLVASGWADGYCDAVPSLLTNLKLPKGVLLRGINGPWAHNYPHMANPGPSVDWLSETVKWWLYCLDGEKTWEDEWKMRPIYSAFMENREEPDIIVERRTGRWVSEMEWPVKNRQTCLYFGHDKKLHFEQSAVLHRVFKNFSSPLSTGLDCGRLGYGKDPDFPVDQRHEDANSLCFDSDILTERLEILGAPIVKLSLQSTTKVASIVVRICDLDPRTGSSALVSYGVLNLTRRNSHEIPSELVPGELYENVVVKCGDIGHAFPEGNKIRVAISTAMWPYTWPCPESFKLNIHTLTRENQIFSHLILPRRPLPQDKDEASANQPKISSFYRAPRKGSAIQMTEIRPTKLGTRHLGTDYVTGTKILSLTKDYGCFRNESHGLEHDECTEEIYTITDPKHKRFAPDPLSAKVEIKYAIELGRSQEWAHRLMTEGRWNVSDSNECKYWRIRVETNTKVHSNEKEFEIKSELNAYEYGKDGQTREKIFAKLWTNKIPRNLI